MTLSVLIWMSTVSSLSFQSSFMWWVSPAKRWFSCVSEQALALLPSGLLRNPPRPISPEQQTFSETGSQQTFYCTLTFETSTFLSCGMVDTEIWKGCFKKELFTSYDVLALQTMKKKKKAFDTYNYDSVGVIFFYQEETQIALKCKSKLKHHYASAMGLLTALDRKQYFHRRKITFLVLTMLLKLAIERPVMK